jgi:pimeloyl-ACP methyl ester carboxylesterase
MIVAKHLKTASIDKPAVRTRRAYFDCRFGQLHVRTAFPTTGGFDEQVTLFCLHASAGSSRSFARFLPQIALERSVYAPDLPGSGESDPSSTAAPADAAAAISDFANDLRLRQIDVLGVRDGADVAIALANARPELVRRLVIIGVPALEDAPSANHKSLVLRDNAEDLLDSAPEVLAQQIGGFLRGP